MKRILNFLILLFSLNAFAQNGPVSNVWVPDLGNGMYKNPVLYADYSDPDAVRVGEDYYMIASSFESVPGMPILHSKDLVNWRLVGHVLPHLEPREHFSTTRHGEGIWAPSIRYHKGEFYIYFPDPDFGIYLTKAKKAEGPWSEPVLVAGGKGLIDPCPLWDDDGQVYLVYAYAGSRAGIKSVLAVKKLNADGTKALDDGVIVFDGHEQDQTVEGPKFYKRNGYYYIFAPAGGVATGWQLALRSKNVYGPYERKVVLEQGGTPINGPHQGAWVTTQRGEDWFLHFQDAEAYGRIVHLQPMHWKEDWPVMGIDKDGNGIGEPVLQHKKPNVGKIYGAQTPPESDEFNSTQPGLQWQWWANPKATWAFMNSAKGSLRLYTQQVPAAARNLWEVPNVLLQKFPAETFTMTTKVTVTFNPKQLGEKVGLGVMGLSYAALSLKGTTEGVQLVYGVAKDADKGKPEIEREIKRFKENTFYLRVKVARGAKCSFSYSVDGKSFTEVGEVFEATPGRWTGARVGLFAIRTAVTNDAGYADFDWFRVEPLQ